MFIHIKHVPVRFLVIDTVRVAVVGGGGDGSNRGCRGGGGNGGHSGGSVDVLVVVVVGVVSVVRIVRFVQPLVFQLIDVQPLSVQPTLQLLDLLRLRVMDVLQVGQGRSQS